VPTPVRPPLASMMERDTLPPHVRMLSDESVAAAVADVRAAGHSWAWVEGFSGSGKSAFAEQLARALGWRHVELDNLTRETAAHSSRYAEYIDQRKLVAELGPNLREGVVVDGVCLRDVVNADPQSAHRIYVARVTEVVDGTLTWHDGISMEGPDAGLPWLTLENIRYHASCHPYADSQSIFLRRE
jgi:MoxR-like ATPase